MRGQQRGRPGAAHGQRGRSHQTRSAGSDQHVRADQQRGPHQVYGQREPAAVHRVQVSDTVVVVVVVFLRRISREREYVSSERFFFFFNSRVSR